MTDRVTNSDVGYVQSLDRKFFHVTSYLERLQQHRDIAVVWIVKQTSS